MSSKLLPGFVVQLEFSIAWPKRSSRSIGEGLRLEA
jgi:hypothetical protein